MEKISVLIVDDHDMFRRGLKSFLESDDELELISEAKSGVDAVQKVQEFLPDVVLMDLVMEDMDGIEATRKICEISPSTNVLILTSFGEDEKIYASIKAGAMGYLLKDVAAEELGLAIKLVARGEFLLHPEIAKKVLDDFSAYREDRLDLTHLTPREIDVLKLIARNKSNKEIANDLTISIRTVKTHVSNILSKLHLNDRAHAAIYAIKQGLVPEQQIKKE